jgi:hypothetical protein
MIRDAVERSMRRTWLDVLTEHAKICPYRSSNPVTPEHTPYNLVLCHTKVVVESWIYRKSGGKRGKIFVRETSLEVILLDNAEVGRYNRLMIVICECNITVCRLAE